MKIVLAFDSFKNCLPSTEICRIAKQAALEENPQCEIISLPLGDGGEGTASAITCACGGTMQKYTLHDPLFRVIEAQWGKLDCNSAVFEMAAASGIELLKPFERNPMLTTTYGTGELLRHIVCEEKISNVTVCIGGSATVDAGVGMLQALGVKFYGSNGKLLPIPATAHDIADIKKIDVSGIPHEFAAANIQIASDVNNPLCGEHGAARVFAPQKGADSQMVEFLEQSLENFGRLSVSSGIADNFTSPGDGAAGGLGFALRNYLNARSTSGAELILKLLDFDNIIKGADIVITGEGCSDFQTAHGKLPAIVSEHAKANGVATVLLSGALGKDHHTLQNTFDAMFSLTSSPCSLDKAIAETPENLARMIKSIIHLLGRNR